MTQLTEPEVLPPLSLYIHIPWCVKKCPYCDFNSHEASNDLPEQQYVTQLIKDIDSQLIWVQGRALESIFIGGGTPSLFSGNSFSRLLAAIKSRIAFAKDIEITLEANPGTFEQGKFDAYRRAGINRLSIGIQSFNSTHLTQLGRIHTNACGINAAQSAREAGFENFNLDLMFGLPRQTTEQGLDDLQQALALKPSHLSWYQLTIEKNTAFFNRPPTLPSHDSIWQLQSSGLDCLKSNNFTQYEISAFARNAELRSQHNLNYWRFGDYLAIGAGAHGKITLGDGVETNQKESKLRLDKTNNSIIRWQKTRSPKDYLNTNTGIINTTKTVPTNEIAFEFLLNHFRLLQWCTVALFEQRTGLKIEVISHQNQIALARGLIEFNTNPLHQNDFTNNELEFRPTVLGHNHLNTLLDIYLTD